LAEKARRQGKKAEEREQTFEQALARLEEIAARLESGELALEEAIALAEEGLKLSEYCEKQLTEAEGKIEQLVERMGAVGVEPLDTGGEADDGQEQARAEREEE
jgi:exodeoxyribonuclease VII small subunit